MKNLEIVTGDDCLGIRLDIFLAEKNKNEPELQDISRSFVQKMIKEEKVRVDDCVVKSNYKLKPGQVVKIVIDPPKELEVVAENIPLDIIYEDNDIILINKPKEMVVHPAAGHYTGTLVNALLYYCKDDLSGINGVMRPGIVHRIDMDTTGVIVVCKNDKAHNCLAKQLKVHSITRKYVAIVHGNILEDEFIIEGSIGRNPNDRKKMAMNVKNGKQAITQVKVLERFGEYTYIECTLKTGRTHQIRVHLSSVNHPLLGDSVYGRKKEEFNLQGQTLHAKILGFIHPSTNEYIEFEAGLPEYFSHLLDILRKREKKEKKLT